MCIFSIVLSMTGVMFYRGIRGLIRSHSYVYIDRLAHLSVLARCVCTRIFFVGLRSVLLSRACECSVCLHVARAHLTAWQRSGSQLQTVRTVALPQPPLHCSGSEGGASPNKCGEGKKTKTTNLKNVGHGA